MKRRRQIKDDVILAALGFGSLAVIAAFFAYA
jgi:hypothetical protein